MFAIQNIPKNFYCIFVSEIYSVFDCIYYDDVTSDTTSRYYYNSSLGTLNYSNEYLILNTSSNQYAFYMDLRSLLQELKGKTIRFEVDGILNNNTIRLIYLENNTLKYQSDYYSNDGTLVLDNIECSNDASSCYFRIQFTNRVTNQEIKLKNFKIYSI